MTFYLIGMILAAIIASNDEKIEKDKDRIGTIIVVSLLSWFSILGYIVFKYTK